LEGGGVWEGAIEVGAIQVGVKKSNYLTNTLLGEFKNITQYIINNKHKLNNHKYKCWCWCFFTEIVSFFFTEGLVFTKIVNNELLQTTVVYRKQAFEWAIVNVVYTWLFFSQIHHQCCSTYPPTISPNPNACTGGSIS
jgi:hypothetical protein